MMHWIYRKAVSTAGALCLGLAFLGSGAPAHAEYPDRPVKIINPYGPGGSADNIHRLIAAKLAERTGNPFIVELKTGAAGRITYEYVSKSQPDGYTLAATDPGYSILPGIFSKLAWDHANGFVPVTMIARTSHVVVANPQGRFKSLKEVIDYARANPGKVTYSHSGAGTTGFVIMQQLMREAKVSLTGVPFKAGVEAVGATLSNTVDLAVTGTPTAIGQINGGTLTALAVTSDQRWPGAENVPTMKELGFNVVVYLWFGYMAPKGTPQPVIDFLHKNVVAVLADPKVKEALLGQSALPVGMPPAEFARVMRDDTTNWGQLLKAANITAE